MAEYQHTLTTFFDVLGFRELVASREPEFILSVLQKLSRRYEPQDEVDDELEIKMIAFSDCVVRSVDILSDRNVTFPTGLLLDEVFNLGWLQSLLIYDDGVFLRGALTAERLYMSDGVVFGPALINAYEIESRHACYPRVIVDDVVVELLEKYPGLLGMRHNDFEDEMEYLNAYTRIDFDGRRFVDYLNLDFGDPEDFVELLIRHRKHVIQNATENREVPKVLKKYHWAAAYHNVVVREVSDTFFAEYGVAQEELLLTAKSVPDFDKWPNRPPTKSHEAAARHSPDEDAT